MNLLNNKRLPKIISVFILLVGITVFVVQFSRNGEIEVLLRNALTQISANEALTWNGVAVWNEHTMPLNNNLPVFKTRMLSGSEGISNPEVDFPSNSNLEKDAPIKSNISVSKSGVGNNINVANYSFTPKKSVKTYAAVIKNVSNNINTIQSRNAQSINTGIQTVGSFESNTPTFSHTSSNTFLTNNTLSLTTDLSDNNSPMLIDGGTNPGDPGIPVGDGVWELLLFSIIFALQKVIVEKYFHNSKQKL
ncbi:MAG: hypothetical protein ACOYMD_15090 [Paludibacter sp.]